MLSDPRVRTNRVREEARTGELACALDVAQGSAAGGVCREGNRGGEEVCAEGAEGEGKVQNGVGRRDGCGPSVGARTRRTREVEGRGRGSFWHPGAWAGEEGPAEGERGAPVRVGEEGGGEEGGDVGTGGGEDLRGECFDWRGRGALMDGVEGEGGRGERRGFLEG